VFVFVTNFSKSFPFLFTLQNFKEGGDKRAAAGGQMFFSATSFTNSSSSASSFSRSSSSLRRVSSSSSSRRKAATSTRTTTRIIRCEQEILLEIKVCTKKECRRLGSQKTLEFLEERGGKFDLKVTAVKCLSECGMGPNVELPCGTILNRVKGEESCLKALARTVNEGEECGAFM